MIIQYILCNALWFSHDKCVLCLCHWAAGHFSIWSCCVRVRCSHFLTSRWCYRANETLWSISSQLDTVGWLLHCLIVHLTITSFQRSLTSLWQILLKPCHLRVESRSAEGWTWSWFSPGLVQVLLQSWFQRLAVSLWQISKPSRPRVESRAAGEGRTTLQSESMYFPVTLSISSDTAQYSGATAPSSDVLKKKKPMMLKTTLSLIE